MGLHAQKRSRINQVTDTHTCMSVLSTPWLSFLTPFRELISVPGQFFLAFGPCFIDQSENSARTVSLDARYSTYIEYIGRCLGDEQL